MYDLIASIVIAAGTEIERLLDLLECLSRVSLKKKILVIDNTDGGEAEKSIRNSDAEYIKTDRNLGYGAANNIAIDEWNRRSTYHLVSNPDISFREGTIEKLFRYMEKNTDIGLAMPKVFYPDGRIQHLCKLLPRPRDLFVRRFLPFRKALERRNRVYELRFTGYDRTMDVPYLSGCFMFMRSAVLREVGGFDDRYFLYLEDTDLSRRIHSRYRTVFFPGAEIVHHYQKGSYRNKKLLWNHTVSAVKYFNKWGWFFDRERKETNLKTLETLGIYR